MDMVGFAFGSTHPTVAAGYSGVIRISLRTE